MTNEKSYELKKEFNKTVSPSDFLTRGYNGPPPVSANEAKPTSPPPPPVKEK